MINDFSELGKMLDDCYDKLWALKEAEDYTIEEEKSLIKIINLIDMEMGR